MGGVETSRSESRATVEPFVGISATGRRMSFSLDASLVATVSSESDESDVSPRLAAASSVFASNNRFQFDSGASIQQRTVNSPFLEADTVLDSSSTERVVTLSAGPRYEQRFDRTLVGASYTVGTTSSSETDNSSSVVQAAAVQVAHLLPNPRWLVGTRIETQHTAFDSAPSALSQTLRVITRYELRNNLTGQVTLGRDLIDVDNAETDIEDTLWAVGVNWLIGRQVVVDASYAERTFGRQPNIAIAFNGRRSSVALSWTRSLGLSAVADNIEFGFDSAAVEGNGLEAGDESGQATDSGDTVADADTSDVSFLPLFQESRNINEIVTLTYSLRGRVSVFSTSLSRVEQENLVSADRSTSTLLNVSLSRQLTRASQVVLRAAVGESEQFGETTDVRSDGSSSRVGVFWNFLF